MNLHPELKQTLLRIGMKDQLCCPLCPKPMVFQRLNDSYCFSSCKHESYSYPSTGGSGECTVLRVKIDKSALYFYFLEKNIKFFFNSNLIAILPWNLNLLNHEESLKQKLKLYTLLS